MAERLWTTFPACRRSGIPPNSSRILIAFQQLVNIIPLYTSLPILLELFPMHYFHAIPLTCKPPLLSDYNNVPPLTSNLATFVPTAPKDWWPIAASLLTCGSSPDLLPYRISPVVFKRELATYSYGGSHGLEPCSLFSWFSTTGIESKKQVHPQLSRGMIVEN